MDISHFGFQSLLFSGKAKIDIINYTGLKRLVPIKYKNWER